MQDILLIVAIALFLLAAFLKKNERVNLLALGLAALAGAFLHAGGR